MIFSSLLSTGQAHCNQRNPTPYCSYTFDTTDNTMQIIVDGNPQNSPYNITWDYGTNHNVSVASNQSIISGKSQYVFDSWNFPF